LQDPGNVDAQNALDKVKIQFAPLEHGQMYIDQIDTAWRVFRS
jgi:hypothetical protein